MSDYTRVTNFTIKDSLITGDPEKLVSGQELQVEFDAIATAIASKADGGLDPGAADEIGYDGSSSGLSATTVQDAIDELSRQGAVLRIDMWEPPDQNSLAAGRIIPALLTNAMALTVGDPTAAKRFLRYNHVQDTTASGSINRRGGFVTTSSSAGPVYLATSGGTSDSIAVFMRFCPITTYATQRLFAGWMSQANQAPGISATLSDMVNCFGLGKDEGDSDVCFFHNDATGGGVKTAITGLAFADISEKTVELLVVSVAGGASLAYTVTLPESGETFQGTISSDLPGADVRLDPIAWINTGSQTSPPVIGVSKVAHITRY